MTADVSVLLAKIAEQNREIDLLRLGLEELNDRFESLGVLARLVTLEDEVRVQRREDGEEDLVG